jgi:hypothetical protein
LNQRGRLPVPLLISSGLPAAAASPSASSNLVQNSTSGYSISSTLSVEWSGENLGYTQGYIVPTSGILTSYRASVGSELMYYISPLRYNISLSNPSINVDQLATDALFTSLITKIIGGSENDKTFVLTTTSEVDLRAGLDTIVFSQAYSKYNFSRVPGSSSSVNIVRDGSNTLVKNVEFFQFADSTKTIAQIISSLP